MRGYPVIDMYKTGQKIKHLMQSRGLNIYDVQKYLGLATPQSIYHWFRGRNMPTVDNLYALSELFQVPVDTMLCGSRKVQYHHSSRTSYYRIYRYYQKIMQLQVG